MLITLSGGDLGGQQIEWPEGEGQVVVDGNIYRLVSGESMAVFAGKE